MRVTTVFPTGSAVLLTLAAALGNACEVTADVNGCAEACATREPACPTCPAVADEICIDDLCTGRGDDVCDLAGDVNIDRNLDGVTSLVVAVVDGRTLQCADLGDLRTQSDVLAGNALAVSGGSFHPDLSFGRVPEGAMLVAVDALDTNDNVIATGCVTVDAAGASVDVGVVEVAH